MKKQEESEDVITCIGDVMLKRVKWSTFFFLQCNEWGLLHLSNQFLSA